MAVAVRQQVYFPAQTEGPGLIQALKQLRDNPLARYTLLQQRRRLARVPPWRRWWVASLGGVAGLGLVYFGRQYLPLVTGYQPSANQPDWLLPLLLSGAIALIWFGVWLATGVFAAARDAVCMLGDDARRGRMQGVDELVAISALNDNEILAAILRVVIAPLLWRIAVGAGAAFALCWILTAWGGSLNHLGDGFSSSQYSYAQTLNYQGYSSYYGGRGIGATGWNSFGSVVGGIFTVGMLLLHGAVGSVILLLMLIAAGRRTGSWAIASIAGASQAAGQLLFIAITANAGALLPLAELRSEAGYITNFYGWEGVVAVGTCLLTGPALIVVLLRMMRNLPGLRYFFALAPLPLLGLLGLAASAVVEPNSVISALGFVAMQLGPGFGLLAVAQGLLDPACMPLQLVNYGGMTGFDFNTLWLLKVLLQAVFLVVMTILARDAVRLSRQPGSF